MMVARQLQRMSMVPRMEGEETMLCGSDEGMVQLGLVKEWALTRAVDRAKEVVRTIRAMALVPARSIWTSMS